MTNMLVSVIFFLYGAYRENRRINTSVNHAWLHAEENTFLHCIVYSVHGKEVRPPEFN